MAAMSEEVQELFKSVPTVVFATSRGDAQPNANIVAMKAIIDDETVYLSDQFFNKTLANIKENPQVAIVFWNNTHAYEIYGTARYVDAGAEFEQQKVWVDEAFQKMGLPISPKGGCFVHVESIYNSKSGPGAGERII